MSPGPIEGSGPRVLQRSEAYPLTSGFPIATRMGEVTPVGAEKTSRCGVTLRLLEQSYIIEPKL